MSSSSALASPYPSPGEILDDKYRIEKMLGEGGMGAVVRATHLLLHRTVAVKFMNPIFMSFPGAVERFLNEGRASGAIRSEHVVPVTDVGCLPSGTPYLVMECLDGLDLADLLARDGPTLPTPRAVHFVIQILRGLQAAHAIGIIHRDMKPSNCFVVSHDDDDDFVKILDFGISKIVQPGGASLTQTNTALGTPLYMSLEQARRPRDVDARSDLYSVGVILYELLSGRTPYVAETEDYADLLYQLFTAEPAPIRELCPELPDGLADVVHTALAREPEHRYASALEMAEALLPFAGERSIRIVERMRVYKPSKDSVLPGPGLPTSLAAFSQLQKSHVTGAADSAPEIEVGSPVTVILEEASAPKPEQKTALLPNRPVPSSGALPQALSQPRRAASSQPETVRSNAEAGLGATQLAHAELRPRGAAASEIVATGAERGGTERAGSSSRRTAMLIAAPMLVVAIGAVAAWGTRSAPADAPGPTTATASVSAALSGAPEDVAPSDLGASTAPSAPIAEPVAPSAPPDDTSASDAPADPPVAPSASAAPAPSESASPASTAARAKAPPRKPAPTRTPASTRTGSSLDKTIRD